MVWNHGFHRIFLRSVVLVLEVARSGLSVSGAVRASFLRLFSQPVSAVVFVGAAFKLSVAAFNIFSNSSSSSSSSSSSFLA